MVICDLNIQKHLLVIFKFLKKTSKNRNSSFWNLKTYQNKVFQNEVGPAPLDSIFHSLSIKHVFTHIFYSKLWRKHPKIDTAVFGNLKVFKENNFRKMGDHHSYTPLLISYLLDMFSHIFYVQKFGENKQKHFWP